MIKPAAQWNLRMESSITLLPTTNNHFYGTGGFGENKLPTTQSHVCLDHQSRKVGIRMMIARDDDEQASVSVAGANLDY